MKAENKSNAKSFVKKIFIKDALKSVGKLKPNVSSAKSVVENEKIFIKDALKSVNKLKANVKLKANASPRLHDKTTKTIMLYFLSGVTVCSFLSLLAASYIFEDDNPHAKVLAEYSQTAGTTSLGALVVLLSR